MPTNYSITIRNLSNQDRRFLLFQDMPLPTNVPSGQVFTNVYQRSPRIQSGEQSRVKFSMTNEFFALYGTATAGDDGTVRVYTSNSLPAKLGPDGTVACLTAQDGTDPVWDDAAAEGKFTQAKGGFEILTDSTFKYPNPNAIYIGCGARDPKSPDSVIPIQTYIATPGTNSQLFPKVRYYVCFGEYQPGMVVDRNMIGKVLQVDFTGASINDAVFTLSNNGAYEPDPSVKANGVKWSFGNLGGA